jgi:solute:Na+ symporter, SSS family
MNDLAPLSIGAWVFVSCYLGSLLIIGWVAKRARTENTMQDFYLAGSGFGTPMLFMTLFATQYSGNTFFAFTGATYRIGYAWVVSLHFMTAVIVVYLLFAPKLHLLAKKNGFLTPGDYVENRYQSKLLVLLVTTVMIAVLANFLLAQLMAMGRAMQGLSPESGGAAYNAGVIILALIMLAYGTLGGIRAVVWTDALQGCVLLIGFSILIVMLFDRFGPLERATQILIQLDLKTGSRKALVPSSDQCRQWLSYILAVGFGICLYPQAIQRIYAASTLKTLKRSMTLMAFMPIPTMIISVIAGIMALAYLPGLEGASSDQIFGRVLREIQLYSVLGHMLVVLILSAILAAMMSTADSALLSLSSMITKDIFAQLFPKRLSEENLTHLGKCLSCLMLALLVLLAITLKDKSSLVQLLDRKLDMLLQLVPVFIVGINWKNLDGRAAIVGLIIGVSLALFMAFGNLSFVVNGKVFGFHPGIIALIPNLGITILLSLWFNSGKKTSNEDRPF